MNDITSKKPKLTDFQVYTENPFLEQIATTIKTRRKSVQVARKNISLTNTETGETEDETIFMSIQEKVDKEQFSKIFVGQTQYLYDLSNTATKVFFYFLNALKINQASVLFDINECKTITKLKDKHTIYKALAELVDKKIIARETRPHIYWINPQVIFNGDRMVIIKQYYVDKQLQLFKEGGEQEQISLPKISGIKSSNKTESNSDKGTEIYYVS